MWMGPSSAATTPTLVLERMPKTMIARGYYNLMVSLDFNELIRYENLFLEAIKSFSKICKQLAEQIPENACGNLQNIILLNNNHIRENREVIQSFFPGRSRRSFWRTFGLMDSGDRARIDYNLDALRQNDEAIETRVNHEVSVASSLYDFVNKSMITIDRKGLELMDKFQSLKTEIRKGINFTNHVKQIVGLETSLLESGMWIQQLADHIKQRQAIFMRILMGEIRKSDLLLHIVGPNELMKSLVEAEPKLEKGIKFPVQITPEIFELSRLTYKFSGNRMLTILVGIPLVDMRKYETTRVFLTPRIIDNVVSFFNLNRDIMIKNTLTEWGYIISEEEYDSCKRTRDEKICNFKEPEENLARSNSCVAQLIFQPTQSECAYKTLKVNHTLWFATPEENIWRYIAAWPTTVNMSNGENDTTITIQGTGKIFLTEGASLSTKEVKIRHRANLFQNHGIKVKEDTVNIHIPSLKEWQLSKLPILNESERIYSFLDNRRMFELGTDIKDLEKERPILKNLIYAPLENPWLSTGVIVGGICLLILIISGFKGKLSCCTKVSYLQTESTGKSAKKRLKKPKLEISGPVLINDHARLKETRINMKDIKKESSINREAGNEIGLKPRKPEQDEDSGDIVVEVITEGEEPLYVEPKEMENIRGVKCDKEENTTEETEKPNLERKQGMKVHRSRSKRGYIINGIHVY